MTAGTGQSAGAPAGISERWVQDWKAVRGADDIQFLPLSKPPVTAPAEPPSWLRHLGEWLEWLFEPIGRALGMSWPTFRYILIGLGIVLALFLLWKWVLQPFWARWSTRGGAEEDAAVWTPDRAEAIVLLDDADKLADEGRFGEAAHLLLQRSVQHIRETRPDWLSAATTAREIAVLPMLPDSGRQAFAIIADRSERAVFAMRDVNGQDWAAARAAYARFAQIELRV